jgi:hypothetical protein
MLKKFAGMSRAAGIGGSGIIGGASRLFRNGASPKAPKGGPLGLIASTGGVDMGALGGVKRSFFTKSKRVPYGNDF